MRTHFRPRLLPLMLAASLITGCAVGPTYRVPNTPNPAAFKEAAGWTPAAPADALERGPWWNLFNDPILNQLASQVEVSNQNVAAAVASYAAARALVQEQRASLFPTVNLGLTGDRSGGKDRDSESSYRLNIGGSWEPDVWGRLRAGVTSAGAGAAASAADLASARLSAQGELAVNYFALRQSDAQKALLATTLEGYERVLTITKNRYEAGIVGKSDVLQAETQLANARVDDLSLTRSRAQYEHAIAILIGKPPANFTLASAPWTANVPDVPDVPVLVPSTLLERRPDIAAAERRVAAANAQIGIARSAYYPNIGLSASLGSGGSKLGDLFSASNLLWSFGASVAQSIFNAGATRANVAGAEAQQQVAVARYRQTVLDAFGDVENQLTATRVLAQQQVLRKQASAAADQVETQMLNRYQAGQVGYTEVVQAQATALSARRALVQSQADRQTTAVALIQSLGGGWKASIE
jgi:NodT family efflux transporter outer membrane factor (OMF) lipoprotein